MKLTQSHRDRLFRMLDEHIVSKVGLAALQDHFELLLKLTEGQKTYEQVQKQFRWNILYRVPSGVRQGLIDEIYAYADDTHIDTSLASYVRNRPDIKGFIERCKPAAVAA